MYLIWKQQEQEVRNLDIDGDKPNRCAQIYQRVLKVLSDYTSKFNKKNLSVKKVQHLYFQVRPRSIIHPLGRALTCDLCANSFIMVVFEKIFGRALDRKFSRKLVVIRRPFAQRATKAKSLSHLCCRLFI